MSLKYVTKKLKDQSLEEEGGLPCPQEGHLEESGTESEDETETEVGDDGYSEIGDYNLDSGISLNLRSSSDRCGGGRSRQLPHLDKNGGEKAAKSTSISRCPHVPATLNTNKQPLSTSTVCTFGTKLFLLDDNDNHSSEEELEDIIGNVGKRKVYVSPGDPSQSSSSCGVSKPMGMAIPRSNSCNPIAMPRSNSCNPEKRKWSEVNGGRQEVESKHRGTSQCILRASSGSSGDEEVCGLMEEDGQYTPVQFCTSPPLDVYKPRQSQSPPPKLFHMSSNGYVSTTHNSLEICEVTANNGGPAWQRGAFRPRPRILRLGGGFGLRYSDTQMAVVSSRPGSRGMVYYGDMNEGDVGRGEEAIEVGEGGRDSSQSGREYRSTPSPSKRHRSTPNPQNIQRPCLDFEKMQQIKTGVVTSWRQGTELSLFVW